MKPLKYEEAFERRRTDPGHVQRQRTKNRHHETGVDLHHRKSDSSSVKRDAVRTASTYPRDPQHSAIGVLALLTAPSASPATTARVPECQKPNKDAQRKPYGKQSAAQLVPVPAVQSLAARILCTESRSMPPSPDRLRVPEFPSACSAHTTTALSGQADHGQLWIGRIGVNRRHHLYLSSGWQSGWIVGRRPSPNGCHRRSTRKRNQLLARKVPPEYG